MRISARVEARGLLRAGGNTVAVLVVLAAAITADLSVVAVWDSVVERSWPYRSPQEVVEVRVVPRSPAGAGARRSSGLNDEEIAALRRQSASFSRIGSHSFAEVVPGDRTGRRSYSVGVLGEGLLDMLGTAPALGRSFAPEDHVAPARGATGTTRLSRIGQPVALLSHSFWSSVFAASEEVVDSEIVLDGAPVRVLGVMPPAFFFPAPSTSLWMPMRRPVPGGGEIGRPIAWYSAIGRLAPGRSPAEAAAEVSTILRNTETAFALRWDAGARVIVEPIGEARTAGVRPLLALLRAGGWLFALAAAVSCAGLRLSRTAAERSATETRFVLGASLADELFGAGLRIVVVAGLAFAAAAFAAPYLLEWFRRFATPAAFAEDWAVGPAALLSGLAAATLVAALAEIPSLAARLRLRRDPRRPRSAGDAGGRRTLRLLLIVGTAAATVALTLTALLGMNARRLFAGRGGYSDTNLVQLSVDFQGRSPAARALHHEKIAALESGADRLRHLEAVESVGYADTLPDDRSGRTVAAGPAERHVDPRTRPAGPPRRLRWVSADLLGVLGIPLREGRGIEAADHPPAEPVVVVDRNYEGHSDEPVRLDEVRAFLGVGAARVVGIAEPVREFPSGASTPAAYRHIAREPSGPGLRRAELVARLHEKPTPERVAALAAVAEAADPVLRVRRAETVRTRRLRFLGPGVLAGAALGAFAVAGLLLAVFGAVGSVLDEAASRRKATAIRRALGASEDEVVWETTRRTARTLLAGVGLGGFSGFVASLLVANRIPWVETGDPLIYLVPVAAVLLLGGAATLWSARRAVRSEPWATLTSL